MVETHITVVMIILQNDGVSRRIIAGVVVGLQFLWFHDHGQRELIGVQFLLHVRRDVVLDDELSGRGVPIHEVNLCSDEQCISGGLAVALEVLAEDAHQHRDVCTLVQHHLDQQIEPEGRFQSVLDHHVPERKISVLELGTDTRVKLVLVKQLFHVDLYLFHVDNLFFDLWDISPNKVR